MVNKVKGAKVINPVKYNFVVGRRNTVDSSRVEILFFHDDPVEVFFHYKSYTLKEKKNITKSRWEYFLHDSFHIDALEFCKEKADESGLVDLFDDDINLF